MKPISNMKVYDLEETLVASGYAMIEYYDEEEMHIIGDGKLFYEVKPFDEIIKVVKDIKRIDISKLEDIPEWFDNLLHEYQDITGYSDNRINKLCILLNRQIEKLKENIKNG